MLNHNQGENWDEIIRPNKNLFELNLSSLWKYRDLLLMFVKRDFVTFYKQTILGPIWFFIQPIFTTIIYVVIFGNLAQISTDGLPPILFYLAGITCWNYFSESFNSTATTFVANQNIFGKVYFPRLILPLSIVISNLLKFGIQFALFSIILIYYLITTNIVAPSPTILLTPLMLMMMAFFGLGSGLIITSLTTKYRDLTFLLKFGVQLLMYATPVIYPLSSVPETYKWLVLLNPMSVVIETFKYSYIGEGFFSWQYIISSCLIIAAVFFIGVVIFNRTERNFMDTV
ncbi:MAG: ABC transporter permease [Cytophagales bacterium]